MTDRPRLVRRTLALALAVLLLADATALAGDGAAAAKAEPPGIPLAGTDSADATACVSGFGSMDTKAGLSLLGVTLTGRGALAVGFSRISSGEELGTRRPASMFRADDEWARVPAASRGKEDGLVAVASDGGGSAWAVGFTTSRGRTRPLAMRWNGRSWKEDSPRRARGFTTILTDVAMVGSWPFAVGYRMGPGGASQPIAVRNDGRRWGDVSPRVGRRESVTLTGVANDRRGGLWAVGYGGPGTQLQPIIFRRSKGGWSRQRAPHVPAEGVLSDVVATAPDDAWAVGYRRTGTRSEPLVLHWDGKTWERVEAPDFGSDEALLTAVSRSSSGGIWVVGAAWDPVARSHRAMAAWWDGRAWIPVSDVDAGSELHDVTGSPDSSGWTVGRSGLRSLAARICLPPQSGVFGAYETEGADDGEHPGLDGDLATIPMADTSGAIAESAALEDDAAALEDDSAAEHAAVEDHATAGVETGTRRATLPAAAGGRSAPQARGGDSRSAARKRADRRRSARRAHQRRDRRHQLRGLPTPRADSRLVVRNVAAQVGLAENTASYGAIAADFDGDGVDDLFIGRHGRPARLALNRGGRFVDNPALTFPPLDRHGCAAADVDGSGLLDIFCTIGGKRGSGLKSDELWLDPGGPTPVQAAIEHGISDPTSRGRRAAFLQASDPEGADRLELVVTNSPARVDGLPSVGRLYRHEADGSFVSRVRTGFASRLGSIALQDADFDGDGREDLLLVTGGPQAPLQQGMHLYRNTARGLVDVTRAMGIKDIDDVDAELLDLDGDADLDLVQLSPTRLRVSLQRRGRFRAVYERRLSHGRAVAGGDVNGDGRDDIYIVRGNGVRNHPDVMLVNRDAGRSWSSLAIPQAGGGVGEDAEAIDHDGNGLEDFLVLNGFNARGPVQLIAFYERAR